MQLATEGRPNYSALAQTLKIHDATRPIWKFRPRTAAHVKDGDAAAECKSRRLARNCFEAVSYTHLTLPTILLV
eukprot:8726090-Pyramimonas_sp.AAC.1